MFPDISKDRLYCNLPDDHSRRSGQTATWLIVREMTLLLAPVLVFTSEEIWSCLADGSSSIHLQLMPEASSDRLDEDHVEKWDRFMEIRNMVGLHLEQARRIKTIGHSRADLSFVVLRMNTIYSARFQTVHYPNCLLFHRLKLCWTKRFQRFRICNLKSCWPDGQKCERCWKFDLRVGQSKDHPRIYVQDANRFFIPCNRADGRHDYRSGSVRSDNEISGKSLFRPLLPDLKLIGTYI